MSARRGVAALAATLALAVGGGLAVSSLAPAGAEPGVPQRDLAQVRRATAAYHDVDRAVADGYELLDRCFESADGGMGIHYLKGVDDDLDPLQPEALVYEVTDQGPKLVAVEYIVPLSARAAAPEVLGRRLHRNEALGLWVLHAWVWQPNRSGMFADYNPDVAGCPGSA